MPHGKAGFPKTSRLRNPGEYRRVFQKYARSADALFVVFSRGNQRSSGRLGMVVSKRAIKRAVDRNRLKRLIRESFRNNRSMLGGFDVIVKALKPASYADNRQIGWSLAAHWEKLVGR